MENDQAQYYLGYCEKEGLERSYKKLINLIREREEGKNEARQIRN